jgi:hypothetical protein
MSRSPDRLYELLPVYHRQRDAEQGFPLRALLRVIGEQVEVVEADIDQLYENWFIETCDDWVVPYIADLIGHKPVHDAGEPGDIKTEEGRLRNRILVPRREIANTIRYRRAKGALALLELLAADSAGWPARAVEFRELLSLTQAINHLHLDRGRTVDLRNGEALDRLDGPFDEIAHTVEVRRVSSHRRQGRYNLPSVGLFVWRLRSYSVTKTAAYCLQEIGSHAFTFSVLGNDAPLYVKARPEADPTQIAGELNLPVPIRRRRLKAHFDDFYGDGKSLRIWVGDSKRPGDPDAGEPLPNKTYKEIKVADLSGWQYEAKKGTVVIDPELGRIVFPFRQLPKGGVWVTYHYGFSADLGGGEYDRPIVEPSLRVRSWFRGADLVDAKALALQIKSPQDPVSSYLRTRLAPATRQALDSYDPLQPLPEKLHRALLAELNEELADEGLFDDERFRNITLPPEAEALLRAGPHGGRLARLDRLLLEAAYPGKIARSFGFYRVGRHETFKTINEALAKWRDEKPRHAVIEIAESGVYGDPLRIVLGAGQTLQIRAADRVRPVLRVLDWQPDQPDAVCVEGEAGSEMTFDGLIIAGRSVAVSGPLGGLAIRHCTLVPGWGLDSDCKPKNPAKPSLVLCDVAGCVVIEHSIVGSIQVSEDEVRTEPLPMRVSDSILDATSAEREALGAPGAALAHVGLTIERTTVFGEVLVHAIELAENSLFTGCVQVARRQTGCMRFCSIVPRSRTPRRFNCQPDLVEQAVIAAVADPAERERALRLELQRVEPRFASIRYGTPRYARLSDSTAPEILQGADDESEMGVFHDLFQPQRAANLRARLDEFTPAGADAGLIYAD